MWPPLIRFFSKRYREEWKTLHALKTRLYGEPISADDAELHELLSAPSVIALTDAGIGPPSVFESYNYMLRFEKPSLEGFLDRSQLATLGIALKGLVTKSESEKRPVRIAEISALTASKSDTETNYGRWPYMRDFGEYAFVEHLDEKVSTADGHLTKYDALRHFFTNRIADQAHGYYGVTDQVWCSRKYLSNSGVSRRFAACIFKALEGDPHFDIEVTMPVWREWIDWFQLDWLEQEAHTYVVVADPKVHAEFASCVQRKRAPLISYLPRSERQPHRGNQVVLYVIPKHPKTVWAHDKYAERALAGQLGVLKGHLDRLVEEGRACTLRYYVDFIIDVWKGE